MNLKKKQLNKLLLFKKENIISFDLLNNQGLCNTNYFLKTSRAKYILREFQSNELESVNRKLEFSIQKKAYKKGIASKPLYMNKKQVFMISDYLEGKHKKKLGNKDIKLMVKSIKKLHSLKINDDIKNYDFDADMDFYKESLRDSKSLKVIKKTIKLHNKLNKFKKTLVLSHNDLNTKNVLFYKNTIKFIDWEFAKYNDKFFDLAVICIEFKLNKNDEEYFLKAYLKDVKKEDKKKLSVYKKLYDNLCLLWYQSLNTNKIFNK